MNVAFEVLAAGMLAAAVLTVTAKRIVHGVLWLGLTLGATAILFAMLDASFLAAIQLLLYVGGVMTLLVFGVMLTRGTNGGDPQGQSRSPVRGALAACAFFALVGDAAVTTKELHRTAAPLGSAAELGRLLLTSHLLVFEVLSALLLAAMVGAIVLARAKDAGATGGQS
jgi:NADH-quinone oxidoreductase subunit J